MSARVRRDLERIFNVNKRCVVCEQVPLTCNGKVCPSNQVCVQTTGSCDECPQVTCQVDPLAQPAPSNRPHVAVIAGGVAGGVVFIALATFVIWKFCLKGKRRPYTEADLQEMDIQQQQEKVDMDFVSQRSARASTHTVTSMASSVLTRASNIIQIAYIPGVTNRSGPGSPDVLVPPVPPIPAMSPSSGLSSPYSAADQHFFVPDFRDSVATTSTAGRTSIAPSLARASMASTMYRQNAIVSPLPAQTIVRGKAAVVSVKSNGSNSPTDDMASQQDPAPPVPQIDPKHANSVKPVRIQMPGVGPGDTIRSTAQLGPVRALHITKKKSSDLSRSNSKGSTNQSSQSAGEPTGTSNAESLVPTARPITDYSIASSDDGLAHARARNLAALGGGFDSDSDSDEDESEHANQTLLSTSSASAAAASRDSTETSDSNYSTPSALQSPFADSSGPDPPRPQISQRIISYDTSVGGRAPMTPIVEEGMDSKRESRASLGVRRGQSPFSDENKSDLK